MENVVIGGAKHIPQKHYEINNLMQKLIAEYKNDWAKYHQIAIATLLHGEFVKYTRLLMETAEHQDY